MDNLAHHTASVAVQFSGNAKVYYYRCTQLDADQALHALDQKQDMRVVVPGKIKDDRLSLSIANVIGVHHAAHADAVLPVVEVLNPHEISFAKAIVAQAATSEGAAA